MKTLSPILLVTLLATAVGGRSAFAEAGLLIGADEDVSTEAGYCATCRAGRPAPKQFRIPIKKIKKAKREEPKGQYPYPNEQAACFSKALADAGKSVARSEYGNRSRSKGLCGRGAADMLGEAGVYNGYDAQDAINYHARGVLEAFGFKNYKDDYPADVNPDKLPPGAMLVFSGPATDKYLIHKKKVYSGKCRINRKGVRVCKGAGNWAGHIAMTGESRGKGKRWYYTDARTPEAAQGWPDNRKTRRLVGIYFMEQCTASCSRALRERCGGAQ